MRKSTQMDGCGLLWQLRSLASNGQGKPSSAALATTWGLDHVRSATQARRVGRGQGVWLGLNSSMRVLGFFVPYRASFHFDCQVQSRSPGSLLAFIDLQPLRPRSSAVLSFSSNDLPPTDDTPEQAFTIASRLSISLFPAIQPILLLSAASSSQVHSLDQAPAQRPEPKATILPLPSHFPAQ